MDLESLLLGAILGTAAIVVLLNWLFARWLRDWRYFVFGALVLSLCVTRLAVDDSGPSAWSAARDLIVLMALVAVNLGMCLRTRRAQHLAEWHRAGQLEGVKSSVNSLESEERARVRELSRANVVLQRELDQRALMESELRDALQRQQKIRTEQRDVVAIVSHQFRTPLAVIDAAARSMGSLVFDEQAPGFELKMRRIGKIHRACRRLTTLLDNCLTEDRMHAGLLLGPLKPVDLHELIIKAMASASASDDASSRIEFEPQPESVIIDCDESAVLLMLSNLIQNALAYSSPDTRISIAETRDDRLVRIAVCDQGHGIAADAQPHVFDKYFRGASVHSAGAGLGLYIAREIARAHGGDLVLASSDSLGSSFVATLPRA